MKTTNFQSIASVIMLTLFLAGCGGAADRNTESTYGENRENYSSNYGNILNEDDTEGYGIATLIKREPEFSMFADLLERSGVSLEFEQPVTLLAPPNDAFKGMSEGELDRLSDPDNKADLVRFINRHVLAEERTLMEFSNTKIFETTLDELIRVNTGMNSQEVYVGGAQIVRSDIPASDGIIHIVDKVVEPADDAIPWEEGQ